MLSRNLLIIFTETGKFDDEKRYRGFIIIYLNMGDPQIYVRGFPKYTSEEELRTAFGTFGDIKEIRMIRDYAFIVTRIAHRSLTQNNQSTAQSRK